MSFSKFHEDQTKSVIPFFSQISNFEGRLFFIFILCQIIKFFTFDKRRVYLIYKLSFKVVNCCKFEVHFYENH